MNVLHSCFDVELLSHCPLLPRLARLEAQLAPSASDLHSCVLARLLESNSELMHLSRRADMAWGGMVSRGSTQRCRRVKVEGRALCTEFLRPPGCHAACR